MVRFSDPKKIPFKFVKTRKLPSRSVVRSIFEEHHDGIHCDWLILSMYLFLWIQKSNVMNDLFTSIVKVSPYVFVPSLLNPLSRGEI
jgi:hypothetical protein